MISSTSNLPVLENLCDYSPWEIPLSSGLAGSNVSEDILFFFFLRKTSHFSCYHFNVLCTFPLSQVADG